MGKEKYAVPFKFIIIGMLKSLTLYYVVMFIYIRNIIGMSTNLLKRSSLKFVDIFQLILGIVILELFLNRKNQIFEFGESN